MKFIKKRAKNIQIVIYMVVFWQPNHQKEEFQFNFMKKLTEV